MADQVRVRFAPSPTGRLHLGGARTAIYNWAFAKANGGTFILRIDDTDPERSTDENTQQILRSMRWLGLTWDEGPEVGGPHEPYYQVQRADHYTAACQRLVETGHAYACFCTAGELEAARNAAKERGDSFQGYQRTCRDMDPAEVKRRLDAGEPHVWRLRVPEDRGDVVVHDAVLGDCHFDAKELDDMVLIRSDGSPTYNFATVVDDGEMGITHVIRGNDHLSNTPRQILVYEALGYPTPVFAHLSMINGSDGKKLSKRHGATSVEEFRDQGYLPEALVNYLALLGWSLDGETTIITPEQIGEHFSLDRISKNPAVFDMDKLAWMNGEYMNAMTDAAFARDVMVPALQDAGLVQEGAYDADPAWFDLLASVIKPRVKLTCEIADKCRFLWGELAYDETSVAKNLAKEGTLPYLRTAHEALEALDDAAWDAASIDAALAAAQEASEANKRKFFAAVRVAECGNQVSPPMGESLQLLGRATTLARLEAAYALAQE